MEEEVVFLGPLGTYSHQAAVEFFPSSRCSASPQPNFPQVFQEVVSHSNKRKYGVVPIKNSYHGPIFENVELMKVYHDQIKEVGRLPLAVKHCLLRPKGSTIPSVIASHEQALGQCKNYLQKHYSEIPTREVVSTSEAANLAASSLGGDIWAVCASLCVDIFEGLEIVEQDIQDARDNVTTFVIFTVKTEQDGSSSSVVVDVQ